MCYREYNRFVLPLSLREAHRNPWQRQGEKKLTKLEKQTRPGEVYRPLAVLGTSAKSREKTTGGHQGYG